jgi:hypothetical protein
MATQRYSVTPHPIETLLTWVKSGEIAIPEIQRPFVWDNTKVRNLLDSLYQVYPIGYLVAWRNPTVRLKDGTPSAGKRILIDGQQRVTALMAALLGREVLTRSTGSLFALTATVSSTKCCGRTCTAPFLLLAHLVFRRAGPQTTNSRLPNSRWISAMSRQHDRWDTSDR